MNCDKSHELCFAHELFASEHELANAMKSIARGVYKQSGQNDVGVCPQGRPCWDLKQSFLTFINCLFKNGVAKCVMFLAES